jgi:hypothetical protein
MNQPDNHVEKLFAEWREAETKMHKTLADVNDNEMHPDFIEAALQSDETLYAFLRHPAATIHAVLLKLKIAAHYDDYLDYTMDEECKLVAPRAIVAAIRDLEALLAAPRPE